MNLPNILCGDHWKSWRSLLSFLFWFDLQEIFNFVNGQTVPKDQAHDCSGNNNKWFGHLVFWNAQCSWSQLEKWCTRGCTNCKCNFSRLSYWLSDRENRIRRVNMVYFRLNWNFSVMVIFKVVSYHIRWQIKLKPILNN